MEGESGYYSSSLRGDKTLKVDLRLEDGQIKEISISGDFFEFPEGSVEELEKRLVERGIWEALKEIEEFQVELCGISKEDLKKAILGAINEKEA